jgi:hypothetical protein
VRDRIKLSSTDIEDATVTEFIKDAEATIEEETDRSIDYTNCSQVEAAAIKNAAAMRAEDVEVRVQFQLTVCAFWSFLDFVKWLPQGLRLWAILLGLQLSVSNERQQNYRVCHTRAGLHF